MKYEELRTKIKTGDMLLWRASKEGSLRNIIERWFVTHGTASPYSHVGTAWVEHGRVWVMEITTHGCAPRLLSSCGDFDWSPCPKELSDQALTYAFDCFGVMTYSRTQAVLGALKRLVIGNDLKGQCSEYCISIWMIDDQEPTEIATPAACAEGAMRVWNSPVYSVENPKTK
jgi:hypothetical protein